MRKMRTAFGSLGLLVAVLSAAPGTALSTPAQVAGDIVVNQPVGADSGFQAVFRRGVSKALGRCPDAYPVALQVEITRFRRPAPTEMAYSSLSGVVTVIDPASHDTLGEYQITVFGGGSAEGSAALFQTQAELSASFGQKLCQKAFHAS